MRKISLAVADILKFEQMVKQLFENAISPKLGRLNIEIADADADTPEGRRLSCCDWICNEKLS